MKTYFYSLLILISIFSFSCGEKSKTEQLAELRKQKDEIEAKIKILESEVGPDTTKSTKLSLVEGLVLKTERFSHFVDLQGKVDSDNSIHVNAKTPGQIVAVYVKEGDIVRKGQRMVDLDSMVYVRGLQEVRSGLAFATDMYDKQKRLWDQKIGSEVQFLSAKNNVDALKLRLASLEEQLEMTRITAPISGVVDMMGPKVGELAVPGFPVARIVNLSGFKIVANVPENYAGKIKAGNDVKILFPDLKKEIVSKITYVGKIIDPLTRSFQVDVKLNGADDEIKPNMLVNLSVVDFTIEDGIVIPINIIQRSEEGEYVMIASTDESGNVKSERRIIKVKSIYSGKALVEEGLKVGDQIVVFGYQGLNDNQPIRLTSTGN